MPSSSLTALESKGLEGIGRGERKESVFGKETGLMRKRSTSTAVGLTGSRRGGATEGSGASTFDLWIRNGIIAFLVLLNLYLVKKIFEFSTRLDALEQMFGGGENIGKCK